MPRALSMCLQLLTMQGLILRAREVQCDLGEAESSRERLVDSQLVGSVSCGAGRGGTRPCETGTGAGNV